MNETIHDILLERMPEVAAGASRWSAEESAHLAACPECREAWALVTSAAKMGAGVERTFDASGTAQVVTLRLRATASRGRSVRRVAVGLLAAAAAVALYVAGSDQARPGPAPSPAPVATARFLPELDSLSTDELATVAAEVEAPASSLDLTEGQSLDGLDSTQLERVLRSMEG